MVGINCFYKEVIIELGLAFYTNLFSELKHFTPMCVCMLWGPPEVAHICKLEGKSHLEVLAALKEENGMDNLPGAGAEILNDRVRRLISEENVPDKNGLDVRVRHISHTLPPPLP